MKTQITSVDLCFLASELNLLLRDAWFDKAYQLGGKELKLRFRKSGEGVKELILNPNYVTLTSYHRKTPEKPTGFAMFLRKKLDGCRVVYVKQHAFDRILEVLFERHGVSYILIAEFFSRGNVVLCDSEGRIIGLLESQSWRDRELRVGVFYRHPPASVNPLEVGFERFIEILSNSDKNVASVLARDVGLGGIYGEEVCLISGVDKNIPAKDVSGECLDRLYKSFMQLIDLIREGRSSPSIIFQDDKPVDVVPLNLSIYSGLNRREYGSFNEAVDDYFSGLECSAEVKVDGESIDAEISRLKEIENKQQESITRLEEEARVMQESGDFIYQNLNAVEEILSTVRGYRSQGVSWEEINRKISGRVFSGVEVVEVCRDGSVFVKARRMD